MGQMLDHTVQQAPTTSAQSARPVVLIPALKPTASLVSLVEELSAAEAVGGVVVVDDGSGPAYRDLFDSLAELGNVRVLTHVVNLGKGAALKSGLNYVACTFPQSLGVVTADADGQHCVADIIEVVGTLSAHPRHLVIGARAFDTVVPFRSRFGNTLTRLVLRAITGQRLSDTQTGLRGIPLGFIPELLQLRATRYDFELEMLVSCKEAQRPIRELPISTIYFEKNRSSHFDPLRDSLLIYFVFLRYAAASLVTAAIDNVVFILAMLAWPHIGACQIASRLVAGTFQFTSSKYAVFHSEAPVASSMARYWLLVAFSGTLSYLMIRGALRYTPLGVIPAKLSAETILFFFGFVIQREFVFAYRRKDEEGVSLLARQ